ncbi:NF-kappa-B inhibitor alpha-like [Gigantopelta aegis]|uniref:NF-kappa-B inhibitor alpha-like n=1 Tax=Gigantopelta aegis TaxID=1735272 RepID=UPI001B88BA4E|nr:NF-kappa-B inhibitor alpha-like [Gigantopelta aegis]
MAIDDSTDLVDETYERHTTHALDTRHVTLQRNTSYSTDVTSESSASHAVHIPVSRVRRRLSRGSRGVRTRTRREDNPTLPDVSVDEGYSSQSLCSVDLQTVQSPTSARLSTDKHMSFISTPFCSSGWSLVLDVFSQDNDGDTFLHLSIIDCNVERTESYISLAPNQDWLNIANLLRQTPLHLAVILKAASVVRRLMSAGASVDVRDSHGNTPLHVACREGDVDTVQCLLKPVYYEETLVNKYDIPYQRIPQDLDIRNYEGLSCLHVAAHGNHRHVMELLLKKGAKVNSRDRKSGRTVLHYAAETGNQELVEFLLRQRKININCVTYSGNTPVVLAAGRGYSHIVEYLIANGADCSYLRMRDDTSDEECGEMYDDFKIDGEPIS